MGNIFRGVALRENVNRNMLRANAKRGSLILSIPDEEEDVFSPVGRTSATIDSTISDCLNSVAYRLNTRAKREAMTRANRHLLADHVWRISHRCRHKAFLLKLARERRLYLHWLFAAKKRFGLSALNYRVTSNHTHLWV